MPDINIYLIISWALGLLGVSSARVWKMEVFLEEKQGQLAASTEDSGMPRICLTPPPQPAKCSAGMNPDKMGKEPLIKTQ